MAVARSGGARAAGRAGARVDGEDTDHRRVEVEGFGPDLGEADAPEQVLDFAGGAQGGARRGPWAARLGCDGDASARREPLAQLPELLGRRRPEPEGVDGEDDVEGTTEGRRELIDRSPGQRDAPGPDGGCVAPRRLAEHRAGVVDAVDMPRLTDAAAQLGDGKPKPISRTRSVGRTSSSETTHLLRWRLEERCAITQPAAWPAAPRGRPNWPATALKTARFTAMSASPPVVFCTADSQRLQVPLKSRCGRQRRTEPPSRHRNQHQRPDQQPRTHRRPRRARTGADIENLGVERGHRTLVITRKGGKVATIPLAPRTARAIDLAVGERTEGPISTDSGGQRLDRHGAGRIVRRIARRAGTGKNVGPHTLRHAFITA